MRERRLRHIFYFNRYFRLTIDAGDIPDARISELLQTIHKPSYFVASLKSQIKEGKLPLVLTKLLSRIDSTQLQQPAKMIAALFDFADTAAEISGRDNLIQPLDALHAIVELHLVAVASSADRLALLSNAIQNSKGVHLPILVAKTADLKNRSYQNADEHEKQNIKVYLEAQHVQELNVLACKRLVASLGTGALRLTSAWIHSIQWYMTYSPDYVKMNSKLLLGEPEAFTVVLSAIIDDELLRLYRSDGLDKNLDQRTISLAQQCFGLDVLDQAVAQHAAELDKYGSQIPRRLEIYRSMCKRVTQPARDTVEPENQGPIWSRITVRLTAGEAGKINDVVIATQQANRWAKITATDVIRIALSRVKENEAIDANALRKLRGGSKRSTRSLTV